MAPAPCRVVLPKHQPFRRPSAPPTAGAKATGSRAPRGAGDLVARHSLVPRWPSEQGGGASQQGVCLGLPTPRNSTRSGCSLAFPCPSESQLLGCSHAHSRLPARSRSPGRPGTWRCLLGSAGHSGHLGAATSLTGKQGRPHRGNGGAAVRPAWPDTVRRTTASTCVCAGAAREACVPSRKRCRHGHSGHAALLLGSRIRSLPAAWQPALPVAYSQWQQQCPELFPHSPQRTGGT